MIRLNYFSISTHVAEDREFLLRLVAVCDDRGDTADHYYEYGMVTDSLALDHSLWSVDPEALIDHMPRRFQFMTSMDVRQFARNDLAAALDGSFLADDVEMVERRKPQRSPRRLDFKPVFRGPICFATLQAARI
ncbi:MAG TPA: hypothetical protein VF475_14035 [Sphingobium sp.]